MDNKLYNKGNLAARGIPVDIYGLSYQFLIIVTESKIAFADIIA